MINSKAELEKLSESELENMLLSKKVQNQPLFVTEIRQIILRKKAIKKIPHLITATNFQIPGKSILEQASSEITAEYKSRLLNYESSVDLTAGLGIDSYFIAQRSKKHIMIEPDEKNYRFLTSNFHNIFHNISVINQDASNFLSHNTLKFDLIYLDPMRRDSRGRHLNLSDFLPDPIETVKDAAKFGKYILIKLTPMLDPSFLLSSFENVSEIHAVSVENECRELLLIIKQGACSGPKRIAANFRNGAWDILNHETYSTNLVPIHFDLPLMGNYLYEPNSSIMKLVMFEPIIREYNTLKLHPNSHLFFSHELITDFPGRSFRIFAIIKPDFIELKKITGTNKGNLAIRNFPSNIQELKKKLKLSDGGDWYVFASQLIDGSYKLIISQKV